MRFKPKPVPREWQRWFAWHPVKIAAEWVWLEWIDRRPNSAELGAWSRWGDGWRYR